MTLITPVLSVCMSAVKIHYALRSSYIVHCGLCMKCVSYDYVIISLSSCPLS